MFVIFHFDGAWDQADLKNKVLLPPALHNYFDRCSQMLLPLIEPETLVSTAVLYVK